MKKVLRLVCGALLAFTVNAAVAEAANFGSVDGQRKSKEQREAVRKKFKEQIKNNEGGCNPGTPVRVPEPGSMLLLGAGLVGLGVLRNRKP